MNADTQSLLEAAMQHHRAGRLQEAEAGYRQVLATQPQNAEALYRLGMLARECGRFDAAYELMRAAIAARPTEPRYHHALGELLRSTFQVEAALAPFQKAYELSPNDLVSVANMAMSLHDNGRWEEADALYRRALAMRDDEPLVHWNYSLLLLARGDFARGWEHFEWRLKLSPLCLNRGFQQPQWDGGDLTGKRLLAFTEGGHGDALQFVRLVELARGRGGRIVMECQPALVPLFESVPGIDEIVPRGAALPPFDVQIPLQGLPRVLAIRIDNIPNRVPYLAVPPEYLERWARRVPTDGKVNVGLVWAGSMNDQGLRSRSIDRFARLGDVPGVRFLSLQKGPEAGQKPPPGLEIVDHTADIQDFADTAALIQHLDLVISVDTSVAHLAGALAKPVWTLIPHPADFRWLLDREDTPWYPTMRLFRQERTRDWAPVVARLREELVKLAAQWRSGSRRVTST